MERERERIAFVSANYWDLEATFALTREPQAGEPKSFTAKLIDVYPNGYEAIVRDSIIMTRFHQGFDKPSRIKKGQVYKLKMDMWSTAIVVNKGHRLAVHVSSSNSPKYEVHPNVYDPIQALDFPKAPVATNTIMLSKEHPSRIILPVVK